MTDSKCKMPCVGGLYTSHSNPYEELPAVCMYNSKVIVFFQGDVMYISTTVCAGECSSTCHRTCESIVQEVWPHHSEAH